MNKPDDKNLKLKNEKPNNSASPGFDDGLDEAELDLVTGGHAYSVGTPTGSPTASILKKMDDTVSGQQQKIG